MGSKILRAATQKLRNSTGGGLPQEELLYHLQVKTANLKHIFSIKYVISLKVINIYCVLYYQGAATEGGRREKRIFAVTQ